MCVVEPQHGIPRYRLLHCATQGPDGSLGGERAGARGEEEATVESRRRQHCTDRIDGMDEREVERCMLRIVDALGYRCPKT
jgi:hypothetical protein